MKIVKLFRLSHKSISLALIETVMIYYTTALLYFYNADIRSFCLAIHTDSR